ncbi:response regulator [[Clostridium] polysaccharolyticum]|uniref:Stage 0 sporulation protein A homolog n=1 Tax=[Clostridium] polysaccharolyticum TaxID=29364 RepID=A0A1I0A9F3_9FIRM|nr:response regulator [[Clostridium] polysaccharolyticum]SES90340.1 two-component system, response regulator YesN [[Clostridium] polysaccharolyticum]
MYRVFLAEDESLIRKGIKNLIAWNEYGFAFVGEAQDGELAWPLIQKQKPDIVITDIRMPFMDGLSLSRLIKKNMPETTIIILSGYDDFTYAKEAIGIGVDQYLLKPLSRDQLIKVLLEVKKKKDQVREKQRYMEQFQKEVQEYLSSSHRAFFEALISGKHSVPELIERAEKLKINLTAESYNIVLLLVEENFDDISYEMQNADYQDELFQKFPKNNQIEMFSMGVDVIAFLIKADSGKITSVTQSCINRIAEIFESLNNVMKWTAKEGNPVSRLSAVAQCYQEARQKIFHLEQFALEDADNGIQENSGKEFNFNKLDASKMDQRIVEKFLSNGLENEIDGFVNDYFNSMGESAMESTIFRQYVLMHVQFTTKAFVEKINVIKEIVHSDLQMDLSLMEAISSLDGAKTYVSKLLEEAIQIRDQVSRCRYSSMMDKAIGYMKVHFSDHDIDLRTVAEVANISATYFSGVFSQQMGKTFVEYLTELRMQHARELLRCTDKSSGEIAYEVGYKDSHYFSFLFKKVNGCSPRDYRAGGKHDKI